MPEMLLRKTERPTLQENMVSSVWAEVDRPEKWKHLIKYKCASCNKRFDNTHAHYRQSGNYCPKCMSKINKMKTSPENMNDVLKNFRSVEEASKYLDLENFKAKVRNKLLNEKILEFLEGKTKLV